MTRWATHACTHEGAPPRRTGSSTRTPSSTDVDADDVRAVLRPAAEPLRTDPWASVLCLFTETDQGPAFVLERRPKGRARFAGHLSFPGGKVEPSDTDALHAALRETHEEIGVAPDDVDVLGLLCETKDPRGHPVTCYVGWLRTEPPQTPASPAEVDEIVLADVGSLRAPGERPPRVGVYVATDHESRVWPAAEHIVQYWPLKARHRDAMLWGFTAGLVALLLHEVAGWEPKDPPHVVSGWEDLRPGPSVSP